MHSLSVWQHVGFSVQYLATIVAIQVWLVQVCTLATRTVSARLATCWFLYQCLAADFQCIEPTTGRTVISSLDTYGTD